jgi:hypothetical protein
MRLSQAMREWFQVDEDDFRNDAECDFLFSLCEHAHGWRSLGLPPESGFIQFDDGMLTLGFDVADEVKRVAVRTLRVEFHGDALRAGKDETGQFVTALDITLPGVQEWRCPDLGPDDFAELAAKWLAVELARPIELHQWKTIFFRHERYVLADTGQLLCWSDSARKRRSDLGPPHNIRHVHPPSQSMPQEKQN